MRALIFSFAGMLVCAIWGFMYQVLNKNGAGSNYVIASMNMMSAMFVLGLAFFNNETPIKPTWSIGVLMLVTAIAGVLGNVFLMGALKHGMSTGVALAIIGAYPLISAILARIFLAESLAWNQIGGMLLITLGIAMVVPQNTA